MFAACVTCRMAVQYVKVFSLRICLLFQFQLIATKSQQYMLQQDMCNVIGIQWTAADLQVLEYLACVTHI